MNTTYNVVKQGTKKFAVVDADGKVFKMFRVKRDAELHAVACNADNTVYDEEAFDVAEPELVEAVVEVAAEAVVEVAAEAVVEVAAAEAVVEVAAEAVVEVAAAEAVVEVAAAEVVVETKKLVADVTGPKKSQRVRARIAQAKLANEAQDIVIAWTVAELGMTKQLARAYVLGNWNKV